MQNNKKPFLGLEFKDLQESLKPLPKYRARQILDWVYQGKSSFNLMTNLPTQLREDLSERFSIFSSEIVERLEDTDGTVKLILKLQDEKKIETVLLTDKKNRKTACLSTQVGCPAACVFCKTGSMGFIRNLSAREIIEQFLYLLSVQKDISHIVIMGMGEPFLNITELYKAIELLMDEEGLEISKRNITVSTSGIIDGIYDLAYSKLDVRLAVSLTTADSDLRERLMPIAKTNPLTKLKETLLFYQNKKQSRITLELPILSGLNTREKDIVCLTQFVKELDVVVNVIPWNPIEDMFFETNLLKQPPKREIEIFIMALEKNGIKVTQRFKRGRRIAGACGQLGSKS